VLGRRQILQRVRFVVAIGVVAVGVLFVDIINSLFPSS
jgi:hypothetical protein